MSIVETVVAGLLTSEVQGVVGSVKSRIVEEIQLAWGFQKELEELKGQFTTLSELLQGASGMRVTNQLMADWLKKIKDVAEEADNLLDEWSYYKALEQRTQTGCWDLFVHIISQPFYSLAMAHKVKDIRKLIASIENEATKRGIQPVKVAAGEVNTSTQVQDNRLNNLRERVDLQFFQGRDDDVEELTKLLCDPNNTNSHLTVIAIVGLAGLGKTTLSKHISMAPQVTNFFNNEVIWLVVSHNFDLENLLKQMVERVFGEASGMGEQGLIDKLKTKMMGKKFLIILDDVWDTIDWRTLKSTLLEIGVSQGTTLLVTSRERNVVEKLDTPKEPIIYQLQGLSSSDSWFLFKSIYYYEIEDGSEKKYIAEGLIAKCGGVPLAIRVLAGLLKNNKSIEKWREIEKSKIWTKEDKIDILPSLRLSYNYLPDKTLKRIKRCFAFCAIFEEDEVIEKQKLIYMWMAHGFLQHNDEMECMGEDYIEHLLSCSLFQEAEWDEYGRVKTFKMHDLVWTLARDVSMGECLCVCFERTNVENGEVRHLSIRSDSSLRDPFFKSYTKLQTYLLQEVCKSSSLNLLWRCKHLRVLTVGHQLFENFDWDPLGSLIHLRYLNITVRNAGSLMQLWDKITRLYHLQTLCIVCPSFPAWYSHQPPFFLKDIYNLVNLRHIHFNFDIGIPVRLGHLIALQTLPVINLLLNWGGTTSDMGLLTNLRGKLKIRSLASLTDGEEARLLGLASKSNLDSLVLDWSPSNENPEANEILEALQPHENLRKLKVGCFGGTTFPKWLMGPGSPLKNIVFLQINFSNADGNLKLEDFISLRILEVSSCENLTVTFPNKRYQFMESLEELHINNCDKLELLDLSLFPKLQDIEIWHNESTNRDTELVGLGSLENLRKLETDLRVPDLEKGRPVCNCLEELTLWGSKDNGDTFTYLPAQLQHLVALQCLRLWTLESVEAIPNWLGKLSSLQELIVYGMPKLKHLPPQGVWKSLPNLTSFRCGLGCPLLEKDIENLTGEWFKIAHIPDI